MVEKFFKENARACFLIGFSFFYILYLLFTNTIYQSNVETLKNCFHNDFMILLFTTMISYFPLILFVSFYKNVRNKFQLHFKKSTLACLLLFIIVSILQAFQSSTPYIALGFFMITLFVVAFFEESFYRGILYTELKERYNATIAFVISTMLFYATHINVIIYNGFSMFYMMSVIGVSAIFVYFLKKTNSLYISIILHALVNINYLVFYILIGIVFLIICIRSFLLLRKNDSIM